MTAMIGFFRTILKLPFPWLVWIALLMCANMVVPVFFFGTLEGKLVFLAAISGAAGHLAVVQTRSDAFRWYFSLLDHLRDRSGYHFSGHRFPRCCQVHHRGPQASVDTGKMRYGKALKHFATGCRQSLAYPPGVQNSGMLPKRHQE